VLLLSLYVGLNVHAGKVALTSICRRAKAHQKAEGRRAETPAAGDGSLSLRLLDRRTPPTPPP